MDTNGKQIKIRKEKDLTISELLWDEHELNEVKGRILRLSNKDIGALAKILVSFNDEDISAVIQEIRDKEYDAVNLRSILLCAESKELVRWWVRYFEER